ncbi:MAG: OmpH family outer membrane protein [Gammaproteobacteria bacterium]|nr:MAG: OmpH family outer membrane protein [Gammaproteobacteria bacterium]
MNNLKKLFILISLLSFGNLAYLLDGIAVIDYNAIFLGTDLARERIDDLRDSSDYKDLTDEAQSKDSERIKLAEKLKKEESTLSQSEQEEILKKIQTLYQSIQLLSQQIQAKEQEVTQKLQADQAESVQKVVNELIKAKKIKMLLNSQALLAFDRTDEKINLTPEVVDLINKEQKNK